MDWPPDVEGGTSMERYLGAAKVTTGVFAVSRNPIYVAFWFVLLGEFLIFPNWVLVTYLLAATSLLHRQVKREEQYLTKHYGREYTDYCLRVRRYF
jgi:protein-S-isoprenylcysteine O-methyltransferase Ste14